MLAIDNAGTVELAVVNISGGSVLDETTLISTTAIAAASNSATAYYSTTARTSVAYRVVGYVESTQAIAGTWLTAPSTIQGYGGQALSAMSSLGYGQTWQTQAKTAGVTYYNTTGKTITVSAGFASSAASITPTVNGYAFRQTDVASGAVSSAFFVVPAGQSYSITCGATLNNWSELR